MTKRIHNPKIVKERLKQLRKEKGLTQKEVAQRINFSVSTIKQYENGYRIPDEANLKILSDFYKVYPQYILGETNYQNYWDKYNSEHQEELQDYKDSSPIIDAIYTLAEKELHLDTSDPYEVRKLDEYIKLYPDFLKEYEENPHALPMFEKFNERTEEALREIIDSYDVY